MSDSDATAAAHGHSHDAGHDHDHGDGGGIIISDGALGLGRLLVVAVLVLGFAAVTWAVASRDDDGSSGPSAADDPVIGAITSARYQVVTLTNDKLYFGHLHALGDGWYQLKDTYILRQKAGTTAKQAAGDLQVVPASDQKIPGTGNTLLLRAESISQVQDLTRDSAVETAIRNRRG